MEVKWNFVIPRTVWNAMLERGKEIKRFHSIDFPMPAKPRRPAGNCWNWAVEYGDAYWPMIFLQVYYSNFSWGEIAWTKNKSGITNRF